MDCCINNINKRDQGHPSKWAFLNHIYMALNRTIFVYHICNVFGYLLGENMAIDASTLVSVLSTISCHLQNFNNRTKHFHSIHVLLCFLLSSSFLVNFLRSIWNVSIQFIWQCMFRYNFFSIVVKYKTPNFIVNCQFENKYIFFSSGLILCRKEID